LRESERERAQTGGAAEAEGEADSLLSREPEDPGIMTGAESRHLTDLATQVPLKFYLKLAHKKEQLLIMSDHHVLLGQEHSS